MTQGVQWVHASGTPRGNEDGRERNGDQPGRNRAEDQRVRCADFIEQAFQHARQCECAGDPRNQPCGYWDQSLPKNQCEHVDGTGAESDANSEFAPPLIDEIDEQAVDADGGEETASAANAAIN